MTRFAFLISFITCFLLAGETGAPAKSMLHLRNGDWMEGEMRWLSETALEFHPRWSLDPLRFPRAQVVSLLRSEAAASEPVAEDSVRLQLTNGDHLHARLLGMDGETLRLETPDGTALLLRRPYLDSFRIPPGPADLLLSDNLNPDDWRFFSGSEYAQRPRPPRAGQMTLPHRNHPQGARKLPILPERFLLEFVILPESFPFVIAASFLGSDAMGRAPGNIYMQVSNGVVFVQTTLSGNRQRTEWRENLELAEGAEFRFRLFVDLAQSRAHLFLGDLRLQSWDYPLADHFRDHPERWFNLRTINQQSRITIKHLELSRWTDALPPEASALTSEGDLLILRNGGLLAGRLSGLSNGSFVMERENAAPLLLPVSQAAEYRSAAAPRRLPLRRGADAEFHFGARGDRLTLWLRGIRGGGLDALGDAWVGEVSLKMNALQQIRFQPHGGDVVQETPITLDLEKPLLQIPTAGEAP